MIIYDHVGDHVGRHVQRHFRTLVEALDSWPLLGTIGDDPAVHVVDVVVPVEGQIVEAGEDLSARAGHGARARQGAEDRLRGYLVHGWQMCGDFYLLGGREPVD